MFAVARRQPSAILFAAQLSAVLLYPFMDDSGAGRALFSAFGIAILGLVVLAARGSPASRGSASCSGFPRPCCC